MADYLDLSEYFGISNIAAGLTIYDWQLPLDQTYEELARNIGLSQTEFVIPGQVHSNTVKLIDRSGIYKETDAVISTNPSILPTIRVADCIPFFLVNKKDLNTGMVHAGWRGVVGGIIPNSIQMMIEQGSSVKDILVLGGPSIHQCCFEIGPEVAEKFPEEYLQKGNGDRFMADSMGYAISQFRALGIPDKNLQIIDECTKCTGLKYHSYRRDGAKSGRMVGMIGVIQ